MRVMKRAERLDDVLIGAGAAVDAVDADRPEQRGEHITSDGSGG